MSTVSRKIPSKAPAQPAAHTALSLKAILAIAVLVAVIAVTAYALSGGFHSQNKAGSGAPAAINGTLSQGNLNAYALSSLALNYTKSQSQFHVNYSGEGKVSGTGLLSIVSYSMPIAVKYSKYGKDSRFDINITNIPFINSIYIGLINDSSGIFSCLNMNLSRSMLNIANTSNQTLQNITHTSCYKGNANSTSATSSNAPANVSAFDTTGLSSEQLKHMRINLTEEVQSTYDGMQCTFISGTFSHIFGALAEQEQQGAQQQNSISGGNTSAGGKFSMCISNQYYIPLTFNASVTPTSQTQSNYGNGSISLGLDMAVTSIGPTASDSYITSLPGPVKNSTGQSNYTNSVPQNNSFMENVTFTVPRASAAANSPVMNLNGTVYTYGQFPFTETIDEFAVYNYTIYNASLLPSVTYDSTGTTSILNASIGATEGASVNGYYNFISDGMAAAR
jgi:hypothetical protein